MSDEEEEHPSIPELSEEEFEELSPEEQVDLLESATQAIDRIIEDAREKQKKLKEAVEHYENISERVARLEILREEIEETARRLEVLRDEEMEIDSAQEMADKLAHLVKELEVEEK